MQGLQTDTDPQDTDPQDTPQDLELTRDHFRVEDKDGKEWDLKLTLGGALRVEQSDFSVLTDKPVSFIDVDTERLTEVLGKTGLLFAVVWSLVQPQVPEGMTDDGFLELWDGDGIRRVRDCMWESIADFFPIQRTALLRLKAQWDRADRMLQMEMKDVDGKLGKVIDRQMKKTLADLNNELDSAVDGGNFGE